MLLMPVLWVASQVMTGRHVCGRMELRPWICDVFFARREDSYENRDPEKR